MTMVKGDVFYGLVIVAVCVSLVFVGLFLNRAFEEDLVVSNEVFSEEVFLLGVDLSGTVFNVGDSLSGTATITNRSGKNVRVESNGYMPCTYLYSHSAVNQHSERESLWTGILKANDKLSESFVFEFTEPGVYVLYVHYGIEVNGVWFSSELEDIIIEVK